MERRHRRLALALIVCLWAGWGCGRSATQVTPPQREWTVMFYAAADNDLEEAQMASLQALQNAPCDPSLTRVALIDRSGRSKTALGSLPSWKGARWVPLLGPSTSEDWGEVNCASAATLTRFLSACKERYPARHWALVLMDHGEAWAGLCSDLTSPQPEDLLSPQELREALSVSGFQGEHPLDLLVTDACLMGNLEFCAALQGCVEGVVASKEIIPEEGLSYQAVFQTAPRDGAELGGRIVAGNRDRKLSLIDIAKIAPVERALAKVAAELQRHLKKQPHDWRRLARCRASTQQFGSLDLALVPNAEVRDLVDLSRQLAVAFPKLKGPCERLREAVLGASAGGLSVFFPPQQENTKQLASGDYSQQLPASLRAWGELVQLYTRLERADVHRPILEPVQLSQGHWSRGEVVDVGSRVKDADDLSECEFLITQADLILASFPSFPEEDSTLLQDRFDGTALALGERYGSNGQLWCPLYPQASDGEQLTATLPARLQRADQTWDVSLLFHFDLGQDELSGSLIQVVRKSERGQVAMQIQSRDRLRIYYESIAAGGRPRLGSELVVAKPDNLVVRSAPLPLGTYLVGFRVRDYAGHRRLQTAPLEVR